MLQFVVHTAVKSVAVIRIIPHLLNEIPIMTILMIVFGNMPSLTFHLKQIPHFVFMGWTALILVLEVR